MANSVQSTSKETSPRNSAEQIAQKMMRLPAQERELILRVLDEINLVPESEGDAEIFGRLLVQYAPEYGVDADRARRFQQQSIAE